MSRYVLEKEISPSFFLALDTELTNHWKRPHYTIVKKNEEGNEICVFYGLNLSPHFPAQEIKYNGKTLRYLKGYDGGSVLCSTDYSSYAFFDLCFDRLTVDKDGFIKGYVGQLFFLGHISQESSFGGPTYVIPVKYKKIIYDPLASYYAGFDGAGWDIYDRTHVCSGDRAYWGYDGQLTEVMEKKVNFFEDAEKRNDSPDILQRIPIRNNMPGITYELGDPYPLTATGKIDMIGIPNKNKIADEEKNEFLSEGNVFDEVKRGGFTSYPFGRTTFYIVKNNGRFGIWDSSKSGFKEFKYNGSSYLFKGVGRLILKCDYLDIIPTLSEDVPIRRADLAAFSIKTESGWGVYNPNKERTIMTPVFDAPPRVIIGYPEGYIGKINGLFGIVDKEGNIVRPFIYNRITVLSERVDNHLDEDCLPDGYYCSSEVECEKNGETELLSFISDVM